MNDTYFYSPVDLHGNPVLRTKSTHPYSYDSHVIYRNGENSQIKASVYSDRLFQWDPDKYDSLCVKHFGDEGQYFNNREPDAIQEFLREYTGRETLELIAIEEGANVSNGYPYWVFHYAY